MTKRNEHTTARVAKIAAKVLAMKYRDSLALYNYPEEGQSALPSGLYWGDIRALAASCLTQTLDKPKRKIGRRKA
jgi:hypothetical protein